MEHEDDWNKVTYLRKPKTTKKEARTESAVNRAIATGGSIDISKKFGAGTNKPGHNPPNVGKLAEATDVVKLDTIPLEVSKAIQKARMDAQLSQKELSTKINEKPQVVNDYEAGRGIPNQSILGKLERALGVKLRGSDVGSKLK